MTQLSLFPLTSGEDSYLHFDGDIPVDIPELAHDIGFSKVFEFNLLLKNRRLNLPRNVDWAGTIKHDKIVVLEKKTMNGDCYFKVKEFKN